MAMALQPLLFDHPVRFLCFKRHLLLHPDSYFRVSCLKWSPSPDILSTFPRHSMRISHLTQFVPKVSRSSIRYSSFRSAIKHDKPKNKQKLFGGICPSPELLKLVFNSLASLPKPVIGAILFGIALVCNPSLAMAATGGRIRGQNFSLDSPSSGHDWLGSSAFRTPHIDPFYESPVLLGGGGICTRPVLGAGVYVESEVSLLTMGLAAVFLLSGFVSSHYGKECLRASGHDASLIKLQIGILGLGKALQKDLNDLAEQADTSSSEGLGYVLTETVLMLLRHPEYCISCCSSVGVEKNIEDLENHFNQLSLEERGKLDEETLINIGNTKKKSSVKRGFGGLTNQYIVVTILVAADGILKLPVINNHMDLKQALKKVGSVPANRIQAVEIIWTPQSEMDVLTEEGMLERYPLLRPLS